MKQYPSINHSSKAPRKECYAFIKYDGSNLRFDWSKKRGWHKFGTRKTMFDETCSVYGSSIETFKNKYQDDIEKVFKHKDFRGVENFTVFAEWFGSQSFAGLHEQDDPKNIVVFDVVLNNKDFLSPKQFIDHFGHLEVAECVYHGNMNESLIAAVRSSDFDTVDFRSKYAIKNLTPEGIICKGGKGKDLWMCKIKSQNYYDQIKSRRPNDWQDLWE
jgi:hypothetical protein